MHSFSSGLACRPVTLSHSLSLVSSRPTWHKFHSATTKRRATKTNTPASIFQRTRGLTTARPLHCSSPRPPAGNLTRRSFCSYAVVPSSCFVAPMSSVARAVETKAAIAARPFLHSSAGYWQTPFDNLIALLLRSSSAPSPRQALLYLQLYPVRTARDVLLSEWRSVVVDRLEEAWGRRSAESDQRRKRFCCRKTRERARHPAGAATVASVS